MDAATAPLCHERQRGSMAAAITEAPCRPGAIFPGACKLTALCQRLAGGPGLHSRAPAHLRAASQPPHGIAMSSAAEQALKKKYALLQKLKKVRRPDLRIESPRGGSRGASLPASSTRLPMLPMATAPAGRGRRWQARRWRRQRRHDRCG